MLQSCLNRSSWRPGCGRRDAIPHPNKSGWAATSPQTAWILTVFVEDNVNGMNAEELNEHMSRSVTDELVKSSSVNPYEYLTYVFTNAPNWDVRNHVDYLEFLMPWSHAVKSIALA
ncbi:MAG: transposase domain-containing protein [Prolixibacteraceae bacterium]|nr:transposase domain-containing protein [Prolixibacteraceae bacterium]